MLCSHSQRLVYVVGLGKAWVVVVGVALVTIACRRPSIVDVCCALYIAMMVVKLGLGSCLVCSRCRCSASVRSCDHVVWLTALRMSRAVCIVRRMRG